MKTTFALLFLALAFLAGCSSGPSDIDYKNQRFVITDPKLKNDLEVQLVDGQIKDSKVLQANLVNTTDKPMAVSYRVEWFNTNGILVNEPETKSMTIAPENIGFVKAQQPDPTAIYPRIVVGP